MSNTAQDERPITIAVSGAGGRVAYSLLFRIAGGAMFGSDRRIALRMLEQPWNMPLAQATAMELDDCSFPLLSATVVTDDPQEAFAGADWIILLAGSPREQPSPSRHDLLKRNGAIYVEHGRAINAVATSAHILVVAAPCNANCMIAMAQAHNVPRERWFALTGVDRLRAKSLVARKAGVDSSRVSRLVAWGNHGDHVYIDAHNALIDDKPAHEIIKDTDWLRGTLQSAVHRRSADLFNMRHSSPAGTAAQAILGTVHSLTTSTPLNHFFDAAVCSDGSYGVPNGLVFGFPLRTDGREWSIVEGLYLDEFAQEQIAVNVSQLEQEAVLAERWFG